MRVLAVIAAALLCTACTATGGADRPITAAADKVVVSGTQGMIIANLVYQSIGTPVAVAMESGVLPASVKAQVKAADRVVITALRTGAKAQDEATKARAAAEALDALASMSRLTGIKLPQF